MGRDQVISSEMEGAAIESTNLPVARSRGIALGKWIAFGVVIALMALFAVGIQIRSAKPVEAGAAPDFTIPMYSGGNFALVEQRGRVVVVNFWASWCVPCRDEAPTLERVWRQYKDRGVVFVGVDYVDSEREAQAFLNEFGITYPNGPDLGTDISRRYHMQGVPETYFVGKDGQLYGNYIGPIDAPTLNAKIDDLLRK